VLSHLISSTAASSDIGIHPPAYRLPQTARVGSVKLAVSQLARSVDFYTQVIGLAVLDSDGRMAKLGPQNSQRVLLELEELPGVQPIGRRNRLGLYHTAFLLPDRAALSSFVEHLKRMGVPFGAGDHLYSEALYLTDPDGLTVEVYADRDRSTWTVKDRELVSGTGPVRFEEFPAVPEGSWGGAPSATTVGHVHFYVGDLDKAAHFYHAGLGFDIVTWRYPGALFVSAGGYHHHVGLNIWAAGSPTASKTDARLLFWELVLPDLQEIERAAESLTSLGYRGASSTDGPSAFTDPWGITVNLTTGADNFLAPL
jgi:catechol 2,3-dioxygenase